MSERTAREIEILNFEPKIQIETAVSDYLKLIDEKLRLDEIVSDEVMQECFKKIANAAKHTIWKILFEEKSSNESLEMAARLLFEYKNDAGFYNPWDYNPWIVQVRDELLKRNMIDFWKNHIVKKELGLIWARDSDLFDDLDDPEPEEFYNRAGCIAPWKMSENKQETTTQNPIEKETCSIPTKPVTKTFKKISVETPLEDYKHNMLVQDTINSDDMDSRSNIIKEGQDIIWQLLFSDSHLTKENYMKAANLLKAVKEDACLYNPYIYNEWIEKVRNELAKRKYTDFWNTVIVQQKMGLCCFEDSEFFSDAEDEKPKEFYNSYDKILKEQP